MIKQVIAALLAATSWVPVQAQDTEGQEDGQRRLSRPERVEAIKEQAARGDHQQPPAYQPPAQQQRIERQPRPDAQVQFGGQPQFGGQDRDGRRGRDGRADQPQRQRFEQQGNGQVIGDGQRRDRGDRGFEGRRDPSGYDRQQRDRTQGIYTQHDPSGAGAVRRYEDRQRDDRRDNDRDEYRNGGNRYGQRGGFFGGFQRNGGYTNGYADRGNWNRGWRTDNRYDWGSYRQSNRNAFHLPRYYAPYGWNSGYRRFSIGVSLSSVLWGQDYWIDEPDYYRLPPAYGPYRWVRYYNDALLVDVENGEVIDTVYDIFY